MKMHKQASVLIAIIFVFMGGNFSMGQQLVYEPINPAFGGNPMNYSWLVNSAQLQNPYKDKGSDLSAFDTNPVQDFKSTLQREILSELSQQLVSGQLGNIDIASKGSYDLGDYKVDINPGMNGINVSIFDKISGQQTDVAVPYL